MKLLKGTEIKKDYILMQDFDYQDCIDNDYCTLVKKPNTSHRGNDFIFVGLEPKTIKSYYTKFHKGQCLNNE